MILREGNQILLKPEKASARKQDGGISTLFCPMTEKGGDPHRYQKP